MVYSKLEATNAKATVLLVNNQLIVKNGWVQTSGGTISFDGKLAPNGDDLPSRIQCKNQSGRYCPIPDFVE